MAALAFPPCHSPRPDLELGAGQPAPAEPGAWQPGHPALGVRGAAGRAALLAALLALPAAAALRLPRPPLGRAGAGRAETGAVRRLGIDADWHIPGSGVSIHDDIDPGRHNDRDREDHEVTTTTPDASCLSLCTSTQNASIAQCTTTQGACSSACAAETDPRPVQLDECNGRCSRSFTECQNDCYNELGKCNKACGEK